MFHEKLSQDLCRFWDNTKFSPVLITCFGSNVNHMSAIQNNEFIISLAEKVNPSNLGIIVIEYSIF